MSNNLEYILVNNFKCKRCGCTHYDKLIHTGFKTLDEENSIELEQYVCRNCDFPINIDEYKRENLINIDKNKLLNESEFINEGIEIKKGDNENE